MPNVDVKLLYAMEDEEKKMRLLRFIVDITQAVLMQSNLTPVEMYQLLVETKELVLKLFPDKEAVYELIYTPRFQRIIAERIMLSEKREMYF
jgi:hypothetical protein